MWVYIVTQKRAQLARSYFINKCVYVLKPYLTRTVSSVFDCSISLTVSFTFLGTPVNSISLSTLFLTSPAARTVQPLPSLAWPRPSTVTSTFTTWAQEAAFSSCAHSSSLNLLCRYKPQHRGTEVTPYKNNKHCTTVWLQGRSLMDTKWLFNRHTRWVGYMHPLWVRSTSTHTHTHL